MKLDLICMERSAPRAQLEAGAAGPGAWSVPVEKFDLPAVQDVSAGTYAGCIVFGACESIRISHIEP